MTTTPLPPTKHYHPDAHTMIWTQSELVWIQDRDAQWQAYAAQACTDLEAENQRLREALIDIKYGLEGARIWGGMEWAYNPLHPFKYLPLIAKAEGALENTK